VVISGFEWDDEKVLHTERHQLTPDEAEEVFAGEFAGCPAAGSV